MPLLFCSNFLHDDQQVFWSEKSLMPGHSPLLCMVNVGMPQIQMRSMNDRRHPSPHFGEKLLDERRYSTLQPTKPIFNRMVADTVFINKRGGVALTEFGMR